MEINTLTLVLIVATFVLLLYVVRGGQGRFVQLEDSFVYSVLILLIGMLIVKVLINFV